MQTRWSAPDPQVHHPGVHGGHACARRRYRDAHSGMSGPNAPAAPLLAGHDPRAGRWTWACWAGTPGQISRLGSPTGLQDYMGYLSANFDPSISWKDLEWILCAFWKGPMVIKGILDPEDAKRTPCALARTASSSPNHGGRQLDGVSSSPRHCRHCRRGEAARSRSWPTRASATGWTWCAPGPGRRLRHDRPRLHHTRWPLRARRASAPAGAAGKRCAWP